jgi:1,4-alpha-glucan branching enzyme
VGTTTGQKYEEIHFVDSTKPVWNYSLFTDEDIRNFQEGTHYSIYELMGSHRATVLGTEGYYFAVWAPNATAVSVIGNFNSWAPDTIRCSSGWTAAVSGKDLFLIPKKGKYTNIISGAIRGHAGQGGSLCLFLGDASPDGLGITWDLDYDWQDGEWMGAEKRIIRWRHPGAFMKSTWPAGCAQTLSAKNRITPMPSCVIAG